jgi:hypothetical protein
MGSCVPHLQRILQDCNELFDLAIVQDSSWDAPLGGKALQEVYPFRPFPVLGLFDLTAGRVQWYWELIFGNEVKGALRQSVINLSEDTILLLNHQIGW